MGFGYPCGRFYLAKKNSPHSHEGCSSKYMEKIGDLLSFGKYIAFFVFQGDPVRRLLHQDMDRGHIGPGVSDGVYPVFLLPFEISFKTQDISLIAVIPAQVGIVKDPLLPYALLLGRVRLIEYRFGPDSDYRVIILRNSGTVAGKNDRHNSHKRDESFHERRFV